MRLIITLLALILVITFIKTIIFMGKRSVYRHNFSQPGQEVFRPG